MDDHSTARYVTSYNHRSGALIKQRILDDTKLGVRLLARYSSGRCELFSFQHEDNQWIVAPNFSTFTYTQSPLADAIATFIIDPSTGEELAATPNRLLQVLKGEAMPRVDGPSGGTSPAPECYEVVASATEVRCMAGMGPASRQVVRAAFPLPVSRVKYTRHLG